MLLAWNSSIRVIYVPERTCPSFSDSVSDGVNSERCSKNSEWKWLKLPVSKQTQRKKWHGGEVLAFWPMLLIQAVSGSPLTLPIEAVKGYLSHPTTRPSWLGSQWEGCPVKDISWPLRLTSLQLGLPDLQTHTNSLTFSFSFLSFC